MMSMGTFGRGMSCFTTATRGTRGGRIADARRTAGFRCNFAFPRRNAPEALLYLPPKEGVGNAGCPPHPRPRVHFVLVERTRVYEYTGITRHSRTQWF